MADGLHKLCEAFLLDVERTLALLRLLLRLLHLDYMGRRRSIVEILQQFLNGPLVSLGLAFDLEKVSNATEMPSYQCGRTHFIVRGVGNPARQAIRGRFLLDEGALEGFSQLKRMTLY